MTSHSTYVIQYRSYMRECHALYVHKPMPAHSVYNTIAITFASASRDVESVGPVEANNSRISETLLITGIKLHT